MGDDLSSGYAMLIEEAKASDCRIAEYLRRELPYVWVDAYGTMTPRPTNILVFTHGSFDYVFDDYASLEASGVVQPDAVSEARLVGVVGVSKPTPRRRDDYRLRGWIGPTGQTFGDQWDKGHFIAHSIGGAVNGVEANVFVQSRTLNRGWSEAGRKYRAMEKYCAANSGVLCFSRPIYGDPSARPARLEFGVLKTDDELWVEVFDNRAA